jgi:hypothetical protein
VDAVGCATRGFRSSTLVAIAIHVVRELPQTIENGKSSK